MSPKVPFLRWDDPFRALEMLASLWSSSGLPAVGAGAAQAVAVPYRTLFATLQQLLVGKDVTVRIGDHDVKLTVTELESELDPQGLPVGQLGEVRVAARDIRWDDRGSEQRLQSAVAVLRNVHIRPGVPPLVVAAPTELTTELPKDIFDDVLEQAAPQLRSESGEDGTARLRWARRPGWGGLEVDADVVGSTLWLRPRAIVTKQRRWKLPVRTPAYQVPLPELPHGLMITHVELVPNSLHVSGLLPEWRMELPLRALEDLITQLSQGALTFSWPSLWWGSD
ncbi:hypothetical protein A5634_12565 [Mycobacterium asiaticum]|uniref:Uncharacterized protein n=1 Tax=Mycobacterium asiaticum TaxID=1790 RepID=A0A1A3NEL2_MYCAS|nr:hypothetical protein [Mycobacterium asiaticum]OBK20558.1 hypothetical protein A5634_12565 [Mycobacterium asiaticum]